MSVHVCFHGEMKVSEQKIPELTHRMMRLFEHGGMMGIEKVSLYGKSISLLGPVEADEQEDIILEYNYFDNRIYPAAVFWTSTGKLVSGDIGFTAFADTILAAYILLEFYTEKYGVTELNSSYLSETSCTLGAWKSIQWLNYLYDERFCDTRQIVPERMLNLMKEAEERDDAITVNDLTNMIRSGEPLGKTATVEHLGRFSGLTDDDRAYFWKEEGDVNFSEEILDWLENLGRELDEIEAEERGFLQKTDFLRMFLETLSDVDRTFDGVYFFRDAFYDFLARSSEQRVRAAVELIRRMSKRNGEEYERWKESEDYRYSRMFGREVRHLAKQEIKRYFAVLGNPALREKWLRF